MTENTCHLLHVDPTKQTAIIGYISEPNAPLTYESIANQLSHIEHTTDALNPKYNNHLFANIIVLSKFDLQVHEQCAVVTFIQEHAEHEHVKMFFDHFNITEDDIDVLSAKGGRDYIDEYFNKTPFKIVNELLIDAMLASINT